MKKLVFGNKDDFERMFDTKNDLGITDAIYESIQEALADKRKTATLFEISFNNIEFTYEITLTSSQWEQALDRCLEIYETLDEGERALDAYLLRKEVLKQK